MLTTYWLKSVLYDTFYYAIDITGGGSRIKYSQFICSKSANYISKVLFLFSRITVVESLNPLLYATRKLEHFKMLLYFWAFIFYSALLNQLKSLVAPCGSRCWHTFDKSQVPVVVVVLVIQIKLLYAHPTPLTKVAPCGLHLGPGLYSLEAFIWGNMVYKTLAILLCVNVFLLLSYVYVCTVVVKTSLT